jgi:hypothetical protein
MIRLDHSTVAPQSVIGLPLFVFVPRNGVLTEIFEVETGEVPSRACSVKKMVVMIYRYRYLLSQEI